jgi:hypothetical protein
MNTTILYNINIATCFDLALEYFKENTQIAFESAICAFSLCILFKMF